MDHSLQTFFLFLLLDFQSLDVFVNLQQVVVVEGRAFVHVGAQGRSSPCVSGSICGLRLIQGTDGRLVALGDSDEYPEPDGSSSMVVLDCSSSEGDSRPDRGLALMESSSLSRSESVPSEFSSSICLWSSPWWLDGGSRPPK